MKIKVTDASGNPVSKLPVHISNKDKGFFRSCTDKDGIALWRNPQIGDFTVEIKEQYFINKEQEYDITVNSLDEIIELTWNYEHPINVINQTSPLLLYFKDENELPIANIKVSAMVNFKTDCTEDLLHLGVTDENGSVNWIEPEFGEHKVITFYNDKSYSFILNVDETSKELDRIYILD